MSRFTRVAALILTALMFVMILSGLAEAQRRAVPRHPRHPARAVVVRGTVFIGGYFYDPGFGPYPWWQRGVYPHWYFPVYDNRAELRVRVEPDTADKAAVYVDGFYAGIVNDFDGVFQSLPLTPGGHTVVLYLPGYRTVRQNIYLSPAGTFSLRVRMERLAAGETSEPPDLAPPLPAPPPGTYTMPVTPPTDLPQTVPPPHTARVGTLDVWVQPAGAEVMVDGQRWFSSEAGHLILHVPIGRHRIEVRRQGYRPFVTEVEIREGENLPLNISLITTTT